MGLTTPALLPNSPEQEGRQSYGVMKNSLLVLPMHQKKSTALVLQLLFHASPLLDKPICSYFELLPLHFTIFLLDIVIICPIMASSGKPSGPGHLANDPYLCDVCGRGFPTKEEYETHRLQH